MSNQERTNGQSEQERKAAQQKGTVGRTQQEGQQNQQRDAQQKNKLSDQAPTEIDSPLPAEEPYRFNPKAQQQKGQPQSSGDKRI